MGHKILSAYFHPRCRGPLDSSAKISLFQGPELISNNPFLLRDKPWEEQPTKNLHLPVYREFCWVCTVDPLVQYEEWCTETISRPIIKLKTLTSNIPRLGRSEPSASQGQSWALRCAPCQWLPGCHHLIRHRPITDIKSCILVRGNGKKSQDIQLKRWSLCCFMLKLYRQIE